MPNHCHLALETPEPNLVAGMAAPEHRPSWVRVDRLLDEHGVQEDTPASRAQFEQWMERRRVEEVPVGAFMRASSPVGVVGAGQRAIHRPEVR